MRLVLLKIVPCVIRVDNINTALYLVNSYLQKGDKNMITYTTADLIKIYASSDDWGQEETQDAIDYADLNPEEAREFWILVTKGLIK